MELTIHASTTTTTTTTTNYSTFFLVANVVNPLSFCIQVVHKLPKNQSLQVAICYTVPQLNSIKSLQTRRTTVGLSLVTLLTYENKNRCPLSWRHFCIDDYTALPLRISNHTSIHGVQWRHYFNISMVIAWRCHVVRIESIVIKWVLYNTPIYCVCVGYFCSSRRSCSMQALQNWSYFTLNCIFNYTLSHNKKRA